MKTTVWCALWAGEIFGSYFSRNEANQNVTANGNRYRGMLTDCVLPEIQAYGLNFNGAMNPTARETMDLLRNHFGEH